MDIEKAMEFSLEHSAATEVRLEKLAGRVTELTGRLTELTGNVERHDKQIAATNATLRRAIRLSVEEHRRERVRQQEMDARFDEKITQLASAQLLAEEEIKELRRLFENWLRRAGGNGDQPS
jgi:DNA-binding FrmR family transcriptional regulator